MDAESASTAAQNVLLRWSVTWLLANAEVVRSRADSDTNGDSIKRELFIYPSKTCLEIAHFRILEGLLTLQASYDDAGRYPDFPSERNDAAVVERCPAAKLRPGIRGQKEISSPVVRLVLEWPILVDAVDDDFLIAVPEDVTDFMEQREPKNVPPFVAQIQLDQCLPVGELAGDAIGSGFWQLRDHDKRHPRVGE